MQNPLFSLRRWPLLLVLLVTALFLAEPVLADPAARIGRIALLSGTVNLHNPDTGESFPAPLNQPLTSGDILTAEANSRAEIQIGSTTVRLDADSELVFEQIDDERVHLILNSGRAIAKLPVRESLNDFSLDTPDGRFNARETGVYRFDVEPNSTSATVYYGALHFDSSDSTLD